MTRLTIIAALIAAPALAATVEDPDSPRFAEGLRVLGMRDQVEVVRLATPDTGADTEPLYLARSPEREAVFRAGEDLCMAEGKLGHFVACNRDLKLAVDPEWLRPIRAEGIAVWPSVYAVHTAAGGGWGVSGGSVWSGNWHLQTLPPRIMTPPETQATPPVSPVPVPATWSLLFAALLSLALWPLSGPFSRWFTADRGAGPGKNGWV